MTVISVFADSGIALTDLLVSKLSPGEYCSLPSLGDTERLKDKLDISIVGLKRKVLYLNANNEKATIFWAGALDHVRALISEVKQLVSTNNVDMRTAFDTAIYNQEQTGNGDFEIIYLINGSLFCRAHDSSPKEILYFGNLYSAGSGANDLGNWLIERGEGLNSFCDDTYEQKKTRIQHSVPSILLEQDTRSTLRTISNGVGGYYESFELTELGVFSPIDNILTTFIKLGEDYIELRRLFYHFYINDVMVILSVSGLPIKIKYTETAKVDINSISVYLVDCLDGDSIKLELDKNEIISSILDFDLLSLTIYDEGEENLVKRFFNGSESLQKPPFELLCSEKELVIKPNVTAINHYKYRLKSTLKYTIDVSS